jgi:hypothetical protein
MTQQNYFYTHIALSNVLSAPSILKIYKRPKGGAGTPVKNHCSRGTLMSSSPPSLAWKSTQSRAPSHPALLWVMRIVEGDEDAIRVLLQKTSVPNRVSCRIKRESLREELTISSIFYFLISY